MSETKIYSYPEALTPVKTSYCAGCGHGIVHKLLAQCIDEIGIREKTFMIAPVGCAVYLYNYFDTDGLEAAHGRAPAVATGVKRALKDRIVVSYQGDGDCMAIGTAETIHAANRGENITVIYINNAVYGMTGGQMAPTTLENQKTVTTPYGRDTDDTGFPIRACELLNTLVKPYYLERCSVHDVKHILKTKKAIKKALEYQKDGKGYSMVEILSMCPTNWGMSSTDAARWIEEKMIPYYPIKIFRDNGEIISTH